MRQDTIDTINARLALARERHGEFGGAGHIIETVRLEMYEAQYSMNWQSRARFVDELLDIAVVAIRGAEQLSSAEPEAEAAKPMMPMMPMMPGELWIPAVTGSTESGFRMRDTSIRGSGIFNIGMWQKNTKSIVWSFDIKKARAIRDWLNRFIAASEAEQ